MIGADTLCMILTDIRIPDDLPKPGPCCAPGTVPQLCDECFATLAAYAREHGMPEHQIPQLRPRAYRITGQDTPHATVYHTMSRSSIEERVLETLVRKQSVSDLMDIIRS